jgi:hypothetical protein
MLCHGRFRPASTLCQMVDVAELKLCLWSSLRFLEAAGPLGVASWAVPASKHGMPDVGRGRVKAAPV